MANPILPDGASRSISDTPPNHYTMNIQLFSQLAKNKIEPYHSNDFKAGGYKWKLLVYPNGNKDKGITDHISAYLVMTQVESLIPGWEVRATFRLFLLDQNNDNYFTFEDFEGKRFHRMKLQWGFDKFIPLSIFNDPQEGYLVNDTCVFGADVYVTREKHTGKGEILSMIKDAISYKHTWNVNNFPTLTVKCRDSEPFNAGHQTWKIQLYPKGKDSESSNFISLFLALAEPEKLSPPTKIYAEFTLRILDLKHRVHISETVNYWFTATNFVRGCPRFTSVGNFNSQADRFLWKNSCFVEAEVTVHGVVNAL
ncbi:unnamed protein product [Fraxinus pennsylvanica]|uniref:MATH domain-containing protein n=1 Tax=Fraxinus pennsylvanica TaxID=56036 RepID=A0AAD1ZAE0_9LAMI|nr:unnamed protein product [Fraxinus pennsylvanica]